MLLDGVAVGVRGGDGDEAVSLRLSIRSLQIPTRIAEPHADKERKVERPVPLLPGRVGRRVLLGSFHGVRDRWWKATTMQLLPRLSPFCDGFLESLASSQQRVFTRSRHPSMLTGGTKKPR